MTESKIAHRAKMLYSLAYNGRMSDAAGTSSYSPGEPVNAHTPIPFNSQLTLGNGCAAIGGQLGLIL